MASPVRAARAKAALGGLVASFVLVTALAGCASSSENGVVAKPAGAILAASQTAARTASAVHVSSQSFATTITANKTKGKPKTKLVRVSGIELQLTSGGGRARVSLLGHTSEAIRLGSTLYVRGAGAFYTNLARRTGMHLPTGAWLKAPAHSGQLAESAALTESGGELALLLRDPTISLTKGHTTTIKGQKAIELKETGKLYMGAIYIATTGTPYPILITRHGQQAGETTFTGWNHSVTLQTPAKAIELSSPKHGAG